MSRIDIERLLVAMRLPVSFAPLVRNALTSQDARAVLEDACIEHNAPWGAAEIVYHAAGRVDRFTLGVVGRESTGRAPHMTGINPAIPVFLAACRPVAQRALERHPGALQARIGSRAMAPPQKDEIILRIEAEGHGWIPDPAHVSILCGVPQCPCEGVREVVEVSAARRP